VRLQVNVTTPSLRLYCFPYAGSSASVYVRWKRRLPAWIDVVPVELPGRGRRIAEPLETSVSGVLDRIASDVRPEPGQPFALFGHSLGAILAFELARRLEQRAGLFPALVVVSGTRAPGSRDLERYSAAQSDAELRAELQRLGGTPASVLANAELMELALPVLRADFCVAGGYAGGPHPTLRAPLVVLGGAADETTRDKLAAWREHTHSEFALHVLPGGHFFIHESESDVLAILEHRLRLLGLSEATGRAPASRAPLAKRPLSTLGRENDGSLGRG
jgi:surfactin synthase thioesterase subunit